MMMMRMMMMMKMRMMLMLIIFIAIIIIKILIMAIIIKTDCRRLTPFYVSVDIPNNIFDTLPAGGDALVVNVNGEAVSKRK